jgi:hypothetical protein
MIRNSGNRFSQKEHASANTQRRNRLSLKRAGLYGRLFVVYADVLPTPLSLPEPAHHVVELIEIAIADTENAAALSLVDADHKTKRVG